jgi:hypothetical protein
MTMLASGEWVYALLAVAGLLSLKLLPMLWRAWQRNPRKRIAGRRAERGDQPTANKGKPPKRTPYSQSSRARDWPEDGSLP